KAPLEKLGFPPTLRAWIWARLSPTLSNPGSWRGLRVMPRRLRKALPEPWIVTPRARTGHATPTTATDQASPSCRRDRRTLGDAEAAWMKEAGFGVRA